MKNPEKIPSEKPNINLDKMVFRFIEDSQIQGLLDEQDLNLKKEQVVKIIEHISGRYEEIKKEVQKRLADYLPDYEYPEFEILFTLSRQADFRCPSDNEIIVDLARLTWNPSPDETLMSGITHEVFHVWFNHLPHGEISDSSYEVADNEKAGVLLNSLDEGFAVNVSKQDLEEFYHTILRQNYDVQGAFDKFNELLHVSNKDEFERLRKKGFESMGFFYVVGYEILKSITLSHGTESIKQILAEQDFLKVFDQYEEMCKTDNTLPKIDFVALKEIIRRK